MIKKPVTQNNKKYGLNSIKTWVNCKLLTGYIKNPEGDVR